MSDRKGYLLEANLWDMGLQISLYINLLLSLGLRGFNLSSLDWEPHYRLAGNICAMRLHSFLAAILSAVVVVADSSWSWFRADSNIDIFEDPYSQSPPGSLSAHSDSFPISGSVSSTELAKSKSVLKPDCKGFEYTLCCTGVQTPDWNEMDGKFFSITDCEKCMTLPPHPWNFFSFSKLLYYVTARVLMGKSQTHQKRSVIPRTGIAAINSLLVGLLLSSFPCDSACRWHGGPCVTISRVWCGLYRPKARNVKTLPRKIMSWSAASSSPLPSSSRLARVSDRLTSAQGYFLYQIW